VGGGWREGEYGRFATRPYSITPTLPSPIKGEGNNAGGNADLSSRSQVQLGNELENLIADSYFSFLRSRSRAVSAVRVLISVRLP
jgi:hypothetical protein